MNLRTTLLLTLINAAFLTAACQRTQELKPVQRDAPAKDGQDQKTLADSGNQQGEIKIPEQRDEEEKKPTEPKKPNPGPVVAPVTPVTPVTPILPVKPDGTQWDGLSDYSSDPKITIRTVAKP